MFSINKIYTDFTGKRFLCDCVFGSEKAAKYAEASFLLPVRQYFGFADLYTKGNRLVLDTPNRQKTIELALMLNESIKNMK